MRLSDIMTPARSREEAAMMAAAIHTLSGGAALKSICRPHTQLKTVEIPQESKKAAAEPSEKRLRQRAALRHVLERQF